MVGGGSQSDLHRARVPRLSESSNGYLINDLATVTVFRCETSGASLIERIVVHARIAGHIVTMSRPRGVLH